MGPDQKLAWAAGFLEGEGCFGWYGKHNGYPCVSVCQIDKEPLDLFSSIFSGTLRVQKITSRGDEVWEWRATGDKAIHVMKAVLPLMSQRRTLKIEECLSRYAERKKIHEQAKRFCRNGHSRKGNEYFSSGSRRCRACQRDSASRSRQKESRQ